MRESLRQSFIDQAEAMSFRIARGARPQLFQYGYTIPFDLSMRRILLPGPVHHISIHFASGNFNRPIRFTILTLQLTSNDLDLRDAVRISQNDSDLTRRGSLLRELADLVDDLFRRDFKPRRPTSNQRAKSAKTETKNKNVCA